MSKEILALIDLDGTLVDYKKSLFEHLERLRSPIEDVWDMNATRSRHPDWLFNRMQLIKSDPKWWENLPNFQLGWDILNVLQELDYQIMVLTQGPMKNSNAWKGKLDWCLNNLPEDILVDITRQKEGRYGRVLVDDYPQYCDDWLRTRPRGLVIMPAHPYNVGYKHPRAIRYDGSNIYEVRNALLLARDRRSGEALEL